MRNSRKKRSSKILALYAVVIHFYHSSHNFLLFHLFCKGLDRSQFNNKTVSFEDHIRHEHNMWHYLYFMVLVRVKDPAEFSGPESYVYTMVKVTI